MEFSLIEYGLMIAAGAAGGFALMAVHDAIYGQEKESHRPITVAIVSSIATMALSMTSILSLSL